ncbi:polysaccharide pyruvyl transferase family protein [Vibrio rotiferianus]|uniref:polysaccharide pyruvyl transferase family protein n=1 Tax=Vibrio rotiferianus TaxID=190895 RepID=UPI0024918EC0|nr:polysaccharide pyruvyl transferase family protein [Vibrio rotiferianus]
MFIEIKGVQFVNKGAELMLEAILAQIEQRWPDAKVVMQPGKFSPYEKRASIGAYQRLQLRKNRLDLNGLTYYLPFVARRALKRFGIITEADIDVILDASGFTYGDQWPYLIHYHTAKDAQRFAAKGKHYVLLPQAFGPFADEPRFKQMQSAVQGASVTFARDEVSYNALKPMQAKELHQCPDFTNLLSGTYLESDTQFAEQVCLIPNSKMLSKKNRNAQWHDRYLNFWLDCISILQEKGTQVFLLNHEGDEDQALCEEIVRRSGLDIQIIQEPSPTRVKALIGSSKFSICSRFHGCVSGLSQGKVVFGTSWAHKYEQLYRDYNASELLIEPSDNKDVIRSKFDSLMSADMENTLTEQSALWKEKSNQMWQMVADKLGQH